MGSRVYKSINLSEGPLVYLVFFDLKHLTGKAAVSIFKDSKIREGTAVEVQGAALTGSSRKGPLSVI